MRGKLTTQGITNNASQVARLCQVILIASQSFKGRGKGGGKRICNYPRFALTYNLGYVQVIGGGNAPGGKGKNE